VLGQVAVSGQCFDTIWMTRTHAMSIIGATYLQMFCPGTSGGRKPKENWLAHVNLEKVSK